MDTIDQERLNKAYLRVLAEAKRIKAIPKRPKPPQVRKHPEEALEQLKLF